MSPFEHVPDKNLNCISSGKKVDVDVMKDFLSIKEKGQEWCAKFRKGCFADPSRFE